MAVAKQTPNQWTGANVATTTGAQEQAAQVGAYDQNGKIAGTVNNAQTAVPQYGAALQAAYAPQFLHNQQALNANQAANGTLTSGAGNYGQQELAAQNNATIAQGELPLIQQGYQNAFTANQNNASAANTRQNLLSGESYGAAQTNAANKQGANAANQASTNSANQANAAAGNSLASQIQGESFQGAQQNANNSLQAQEFNASQQQQAYLQALQDQYGILNTGQGAQNQTSGNSVGQQTNAYANGLQNAQQQGNALASAAGSYFG